MSTDTKKNLPSNINSIYGLNSPIFNELLSILIKEPLIQETQLKIERFLVNQSIEVLTKISLNDKFNNMDNKNLLLKLEEYRPKLEKAIKNYKINIRPIDNNNLFTLNKSDQIINSLNTEFLISIMFGRIINIVSNNLLLNNKT